MDSVPTALPTSKALPGRALASRVFDRGIFDEVLKRDPWHQPDILVCVFEERCEMRLVANPASQFRRRETLRARYRETTASSLSTWSAHERPRAAGRHSLM